MTELELVTLENGKVCIVIGEEVIDGTKYVYLVNAGNKKDYVIRKEFNNELIGLDDQKEFDKAIMNLFAKLQRGEKNGRE